MAVVDSKSQGVTGIKRASFWDSAWLNTKFVLGSSMILIIVLFGLLGPFFWDTELAYTASSPINLPPDVEGRGHTRTSIRDRKQRPRYAGFADRRYPVLT